MTNRTNRLKSRVSLEEFKMIKTIFVETFDLYFRSFIDEGDIVEISTYFGSMCAKFKLYQLVLPRTVEVLNEEIFSSALIRDFHLELLERFSMEIQPMGEDVIERLVYMLADATVSCKSTSSERTDGVDPILISIKVSHDDAVRAYLENPWLITLALLNTLLKKTLLGQKI